ncbi:MAG: hypothetical protein K0A90_00045 [Methanosarcinaceae archaeon]|nr:hypothetical protein [Methanosarcinaceae archaeon]
MKDTINKNGQLHSFNVKIINLTPHNVGIIDTTTNKVVVNYPSEGSIRLSEDRKKIFTVNGIPVYSKHFGSAEIPESVEGTMYIVSLAVGQAFPDRNDFLIPDQLVRDEKGAILGCASLTVFGC